MRKTIDLDEADITKIEEYATKNNIKTFTESVRSIIREFDGAPSISTDEVSDENFALLADAIIELDKKLELILTHFAPKNAGEVKKN